NADDPESKSVNWTATSTCTKRWSGGHNLAGFAAHLVNVGGVLSMLMPLTTVVALLPAWSTATPVRDCPSPSELMTWDVGPQLSTPDSESPQLKITVTSVLFHPFALAAGVRDPEMVGEV